MSLTIFLIIIIIIIIIIIRCFYRWGHLRAPAQWAWGAAGSRASAASAVPGPPPASTWYFTHDTLHRILCTAYSSQNNLLRIFYTGYSAQHTLHRIIYTGYSTQEDHGIFCTCSPQDTLHSLRTGYSSQDTQQRMHRTGYYPQNMLHIILKATGSNPTDYNLDLYLHRVSGTLGVQPCQRVWGINWKYSL